MRSLGRVRILDAGWVSLSEERRHTAKEIAMRITDTRGKAAWQKTAAASQEMQGEGLDTDDTLIDIRFPDAGTMGTLALTEQFCFSWWNIVPAS